MGNKWKRKCDDNRFSKKNIETIMTKITDKEFSQHFKALSFETNTGIFIENIMCSHSSIFIGGNIFIYIIFTANYNVYNYSYNYLYFV